MMRRNEILNKKGTKAEIPGKAPPRIRLPYIFQIDRTQRFAEQPSRTAPTPNHARGYRIWLLDRPNKSLPSVEFSGDAVTQERP